MKQNADISKEKKPREKSRATKQSAPANPPVDRGDEVKQELRKWFKDNRSLHPLALYAKFYSRF